MGRVLSRKVVRNIRSIARVLWYVLCFVYVFVVCYGCLCLCLYVSLWNVKWVVDSKDYGVRTSFYTIKFIHPTKLTKIF